MVISRHRQTAGLLRVFTGRERCLAPTPPSVKRARSRALRARDMPGVSMGDALVRFLTLGRFDTARTLAMSRQALERATGRVRAVHD
jgi:hypothetical protein